MINKAMMAALLGLTFVPLAGCNALASRVGDNASEGWVMRVVSAAEMKTLPSGCAKGVDLTVFGNDQFARVREPHGRRTVTVMAHVPRSMQVAVGDEVEIEPARCIDGVMPEIRQVFKP